MSPASGTRPGGMRRGRVGPPPDRLRKRRRRQQREARRVRGIDANAATSSTRAAATPTKLIVSDLPLQGDSAERSKQMNDAIVQEMAARAGRPATPRSPSRPATTRSPPPASGTRASAARTPEVLRQPRRDRRDRDLQLGLCPDRDPDPQQGARRRRADGLARQHPGLPDGIQPDLCKPNEPDVYYPSGRRNYIRVVPNDAVQGAGLASFANEAGNPQAFRPLRRR